MEELSLRFTFEARYYKLGNINSHTKAIWFVLHGYGQLAKFFLTKFTPLESQDICVIAPEGLSRFYLEEMERRLQSGNNRVGSTWMTRENREMDISNYLAYLDSVYKNELNGTDIPVTILGFSQGAATASRWAINHTMPYVRIILWSGIFPPDMDFEKGHNVLSSHKVNLVYGTNDPFVNEGRLDEMKTLASRLRIEPEILTFDGGHEIDTDTLLRLV
jgi:predicted esterase